ncbi:MAG: type I-B CRISPR-associated protein Cas5b [Bacteroidales bacterium]|nr:type I-B CRISPR-associated protein Cas5b [Bacteroidales bacterium]
MKNVFKIEITSWTSSFRYPNIISGFQPTLEVPPLSTILGLINAAAGKYLDYSQEEIGYYFEYGAKAIDIETLYQVDKISSTNISPSLKATANVIKREFLTDCRLLIYTRNEILFKYLLNPIFPILLGRSSDLAQIRFLETRELSQIENASKIKGQIVPFANNYLPGQIQPLPQYFTNTEIRRNIGTQAYSIISYNSNDCQSGITAYRDQIQGKEIDIYFHKLDFNED